MVERGDDTASAACTSLLYRVCCDPPPSEHTPAREGETIEGSRTIYAESTQSSAQVLRRQTQSVSGKQNLDPLRLALISRCGNHSGACLAPAATAPTPNNPTECLLPPHRVKNVSLCDFGPGVVRLCEQHTNTQIRKPAPTNRRKVSDAR